ncbi:MAG TPA: GIY-YIG nuclease family protein [Candidatus Methylomirabilis sp.]|nr:GIY-YIG nuclease family protein [Candidatus Methylomirabilis sp.]
MSIKAFFVYIMASKSGTLYVGMTNDLKRRVLEHKNFIVPGFTQQYGCNRLIYFEHSPYVVNIIKREKQIKGWRREKKEYLIRTMNPTWKDLSEGWYHDKSLPDQTSLERDSSLRSELYYARQHPSSLRSSG